MQRRTLVLSALALLALAGSAAVPALDATPAADARRGPPWISIEYPPSPYHRETRDAFLLVHAYHHGTPADFPVSGTAEGIVDGSRRSTKLDFQRTSRPGVFALKKQWPDRGRWVLSLAVGQGEGVAGALVTIGTDGTVASVRVPVQRQPGWEGANPRAITAQEIAAALRGD